MRVKCLAQEHNTMTWPWLEPGPLDPEPSALTTWPPQSSLTEVSCVWFCISEVITVLVSDPIFAKLAEIGSVEAPATDVTAEKHQVTESDPDSDLSNLESVKTSQPPVKMTDLLLQGAAAKSAKKHGGTGVDEFMEEIPVQKRRKGARRKLYELPHKFKQTMGQANILWARGEIEKAKGICMELIRQGTE